MCLKVSIGQTSSGPGMTFWWTFESLHSRLTCFKHTNTFHFSTSYLLPSHLGISPFLFSTTSFLLVLLPTSLPLPFSPICSLFTLYPPPLNPARHALLSHSSFSFFILDQDVHTSDESDCDDDLDPKTGMEVHTIYLLKRP